MLILEGIYPLIFFVRRLKDMEKAVITVVGKDKVGIIAAVCNYLAKVNINILDIQYCISCT